MTENNENIETLIRDRRLWHNHTREFLLVAVAGPSMGIDTAKHSLDLGRALAAQERRHRTYESILVWELDFWSPTMAFHLGLKPEEPRRDFLDAFIALAETKDLHEELRRTAGISPNTTDFTKWIQLGRQILPIAPRMHDPILAFSACRGPKAFNRALDIPPNKLIAYPADPVFLPGIAPFRTLLSVAAHQHQAGVVILSLPSGWNALSLLALGNLADVVMLLSTGAPSEEICWQPIVEFLETRRRSAITRQPFEEEIHLLVPSAAGTEPLTVLDRIAPPRKLAAPGRSASHSPTIIDLARDLDLLAASKASGGVEIEMVVDPKGPDRDLLAELKRWDTDQRSLRILVEKGPYGEYPVKGLSRATLLKLGADGEGFELHPVPITHQELFNLLRDADRFGRYLDKEKVDLLTFPNYMLGTLVEEDLLLPLHVLQDELEVKGGRHEFEDTTIEQRFFRVAEMCRYNGVLYAVPYTLIQMLVLLKKRKDVASDYFPGSWQDIGRQLLDTEGDPSSWPLLLQTDLEHVGLWYEWLEFVNAFGGADFAAVPGTKDSFRGSDYGECWINHPRTVEATAFYLSLVAKSRDRTQEKIDWDNLLEIFLNRDSFRLTLAWSDIVGFHWREAKGHPHGESGKDELKFGLEKKLKALPFPLGSKAGRTSLEGWVLAAPKRLGRKRRKLGAKAISWFLSPQIQIRYAEQGGNTARRDVGHALGEVQRLVHRAILFPQRRPALKINFREAPQVISEVCLTLRRWLESVKDGAGEPIEDVIAGELDKLAFRVTEKHLLNKARYRTLKYWQSASAKRGDSDR